LESEAQAKNLCKKSKKDLAFLKQKYYNNIAIRLSFSLFRIDQNWPTRYSAGLSSAFDPA